MFSVFRHYLQLFIVVVHFVWPLELLQVLRACDPLYRQALSTPPPTPTA